MDRQKVGKFLAILVAIVVILGVAWAVLTHPDHRSATDRMSDAIRDLPKGADKSMQDLQDRTPGQKLGDKIKDITAPSEP